jgi:hypothetical protein
MAVLIRMLMRPAVRVGVGQAAVAVKLAIQVFVRERHGRQRK